ncbi:MAG: RdgB/HAM1 family non-canonical purine NTP pyrophosphatase [Alphaproteobacteria bacterium]|nr:RdgB/HAM1 family non-canonical purine NTP pyrophosphatase [Alphaproteobacteria bacterium]MDA8004886.1 RdgB/HAM1 family non-canonical purine NTP pyrophosphatase [Alphaproteobacteria bacterium]MDA8005263.1 RdgB/HAM1 family non-canonical purine NTP pyrophosphatase [Alphaproteobacteria bacterium]MDA8012682.1 RdgB/HAM1 family non-canonical purine NTP pyrophosphatase [Alphaproteobacteria bacterium]
MTRALLLATHNAGKVREFESYFGALGLAVSAAESLGLEEVSEDADTFRGNAELKAAAAARATGGIALADDSGLCVDALDGAPGIYSARWAIDERTGARDFGAACLRVGRALADAGAEAEGAAAHFLCVLCLADAAGRRKFWEGEARGRLSFPPRGSRGFGYDPIFIPAGETLTFGEMEPRKKEAMSHRARACAAFAEWYRGGGWQSEGWGL